MKLRTMDLYSCKRLDLCLWCANVNRIRNGCCLWFANIKIQRYNFLYVLLKMKFMLYVNCHERFLDVITWMKVVCFANYVINNVARDVGDNSVLENQCKYVTFSLTCVLFIFVIHSACVYLFHRRMWRAWMKTWITVSLRVSCWWYSSLNWLCSFAFDSVTVNVIIVTACKIWMCFDDRPRDLNMFPLWPEWRIAKKNYFH